MAIPVVSWWLQDNSAQLAQWNIGVVDAGQVSTDLGVLIFNNRAGGVAVSDMQSCTITTKDSLGGNTGELVTKKWIEAKVISAGEMTFTPMGGTTTRALKASSMGAGLISGAVNDGSKANSIANFAEVVMHANVPSDASAGTVNFKTRVAYQFV